MKIGRIARMFFAVALAMAVGGCYVIDHSISQRLERDLGTPSRSLRPGIYLRYPPNQRHAGFLVLVGESNGAYYVNNSRMLLFNTALGQRTYVFMLQNGSVLARGSTEPHLLGLSAVIDENRTVFWLPVCSPEIRQRFSLTATREGLFCNITSASQIMPAINDHLRRVGERNPDLVLEFIQALPEGRTQ